MKHLIYNLPNGKRYRIRYTKCPNTYLGNGNYVIECFMLPEDLGKNVEYYPEGHWGFISYAESVKAAKETLCLFTRHPAYDTRWLCQFKEKR